MIAIWSDFLQMLKTRGLTSTGHDHVIDHELKISHPSDVEVDIPQAHSSAWKKWISEDDGLAPDQID